MWRWALDSVRIKRVFALLALEEPGSPTADPLAIRYARLLARHADGRAVAEVPGIPERRLIRRTISTRGPGAVP